MSQDNFAKVRDYLNQLDVTIVDEWADSTLFVVEDEKRGISNLLIDCEDEILIIEQMILELPSEQNGVYKRLLQINRELIHGAFALDESGQRVVFRDTLQLENLDLNELEGTINALALALAAHSGELIEFAKGR